ncbi:MAG: DUF4832 domain-containing protein [Candidatus Omnitrophota bacterium]|nr:MAG: DUF4832 domain-containing protein [Candidatus Omnitrophota bacterium]
MKDGKISLWICIGVIFFSLIFQSVAFGKEIYLQPHWNDRIPLENPHKGWYHHFPDNHINKYVIPEDADLLDFPGMDHVYIRLAWAYLEPQEGQFDWDIIDAIINKWVEHGLGIAFRISCKETSTDRIEQQFATPKWVMKAGAKGDFYRRGEKTGTDGPWEPVFDDPIFLEKLENFLKAFAGRYDGKPWLRYVDIGSIGDWGEGHTHSGSRIAYDYNQRMRHIDLHCKYFQQSQLVISDDFAYSVSDKDERQKMHREVLDRGITYRDDSILVDGYLSNYADQYTVRSPEFFQDSYYNTPNVFELEHYPIVRRMGNWFVKPESSLAKYGKGKSGADMFKGALELLHATYIGYHGYAREWLNDNPELTVELLNRCGYWYFLHTVNVPDKFSIGDNEPIEFFWENRGVAPAYRPYTLILRLEGAATTDIERNAGNQTWQPSTTKVYQETYTIPVPNTLPSGRYKLKVKLYDKETKRDVLLALDPTIMDEDNFYQVGDVEMR